ncbi:MAG: hypothetical protein Q9209_006278 [Squamulea sp. 1 TL-2023]
MGKSKKPKPATTASPGDTHAAESPHEPPEPTLPSRPEQPVFQNNDAKEETDFEAFYLKQVTAEFADDLDKLRNANDFNEKSMPVLIDALKMTARTYSEEEKAKVMGVR